MRRPSTRLTVVLALALLAATACQSTGGPQGEPRLVYAGTVGPGCAPWDGRSIEISLNAVEGAVPDTIHISLWRDLPPRPGRIFALGPARDAGAALACASSGLCVAADSGTVGLVDYREGSSAAGWWSLDLQDGRTLRGEFTADWSTLPSPPCG